MVDVVTRTVARPFEVTAKNGDHFEIKPGEEYTTTLEQSDGTVTVFSRYWVSVPLKYFVPLGD